MLQAGILLTFKLPQVFEEYILVILFSCVYYFCLSLSLLTAVIRFKRTPDFGIFMRVCNPKCTVRVFLHTETTAYYK